MACANDAPINSGGQSSVRFAQVDLTILADKRLSETDKTVYAVLAAHRNAKHGKAWPKRQTIAKIADIHPETVTKSTRHLVECGYLVKTEGRGRGKTTIYTFPLADARDAQRRATQAVKPEPKPRKSNRVKTSHPAGFCAATLIERTESAKADPTTLPSPPTRPTPELEEPQGGERRLAWPKNLTGPTCAKMARMMRIAGVPYDEQQALFDEVAWNARDHGIKRPLGYLRRLLELRSQGRLTLEVAHLEAERRVKIAENEQAIQAAEQRHLAALERGMLPLPEIAPPKISFEAAKAQVKQSPRCALLSEEERERLRQEYLASIGQGPKPAPAAPPVRGEGYAKFKEEMAKLKSGGR